MSFYDDPTCVSCDSDDDIQRFPERDGDNTVAYYCWYCRVTTWFTPLTVYLCQGTDKKPTKRRRASSRAAPSAGRKQRAVEPQSGSVYFIGADDGGPVKIGFTTKDPEQRMRDLQTGSARNLRVLGSYAGTIEDERRMHEAFASRNVRGEWFDLSVQEVCDVLGGRE